ncbi:MAG: sigma-70 family RNA polymerase sigma factor [Pseudomonadales bacterium]|nr:sigma-70 family RNA polymerase sigma factor [Pseudomonadales bacterium]MCP5185780.1 sigma-70 family RNA polymerase sigma factor [Pseudomonadales bacterium]
MKPDTASIVASLHARHDKGLVRYLAAKFGDPEEARDIAQEAWTRIARLRDPQSLENPKAFLFQTATNLAIDRVRHLRVAQRHEETSLEEASVPAAEESAMHAQSLRIIQAALRTLPEKTQRAFLMHRLDGFSYPEIARELGVSESMVEKYIIQVLRTFRQALGGSSAGAEPRVPNNRAPP